MRTPRILSEQGLDRITMEAQNQARERVAQTPLLGGEDPQMHPSDFSGATPRPGVASTPNPLLGMTPRGGQTPAVAGNLGEAVPENMNASANPQTAPAPPLVCLLIGAHIVPRCALMEDPHSKISLERGIIASHSLVCPALASTAASARAHCIHLWRPRKSCWEVNGGMLMGLPGVQGPLQGVRWRWPERH